MNSDSLAAITLLPGIISQRRKDQLFSRDDERLSDSYYRRRKEINARETGKFDGFLSVPQSGGKGELK